MLSNMDQDIIHIHPLTHFLINLLPWIFLLIIIWVIFKIVNMVKSKK